MRVMNQGSEYEEDSTATNTTEADEDTSAGIGKIAGIPVKALIIGGAVVLLMVLFVVVFGSKKSGDTADDIVIPNVGASDTQSNATQMKNWYTKDGAYLGMSMSTADGTQIYDGATLTATISASGSAIITDDTGMELHAELASNEAISDDTATTDQSIPATGTGSFTAEQIEQLKKLGYTGDEISIAARDMLNYDALVAKAQELREAEALAEIARMSDQASEEFQTLLKWGTFAFPYREFTPRNGENIAYNQPGNYVVNADYEKVPTYGLQLELKVKIANGTYVYMPVEPARWETLPDSGNIVVQVNYIRYGTAEVNQVYITSITERDITTVTVNPEDSTQNFEDLTAAGG